MPPNTANLAGVIQAPAVALPADMSVVKVKIEEKQKKEAEREKDKKKEDFEITGPKGRTPGPDPLLVDDTKQAKDAGRKQPAAGKGAPGGAAPTPAAAAPAPGAGRPKPNRAQKLAPYVLEVVCLQPQTIKLKSTYDGETNWQMENTAGTTTAVGADLDYIAKAHWFRGWRAFQALAGSFKPRETLIAARVASHPVNKQWKIREYPGDEFKLKLTYDRKEGQWGVKKQLGKQVEGGKKDETGFDLDLTWEPKMPLGFKDGLIKGVKQLHEIVSTLEAPFKVLAAPKDGTKMELLPRLSASCEMKWAEVKDDHRVYLRVAGKADVEIFSGEVMIPFGPFGGIPGWLKQWTTDWVGDAYLYIKINGLLAIEAEWKRSGPDAGDRKFEAVAKGEVGIKVGASIFLFKKSLVNLDVSGGSKLTLKAGIDKERAEHFEFIFDVHCSGLEVAITAVSGWGLIKYKQKWKMIDGGSLFPGGAKRYAPFAGKDGEGGDRHSGRETDEEDEDDDDDDDEDEA